ncbi:MAG: hypothetical protein HKN68_04195 [Saprospiraceae bacterium]|nr:hypothetical protein [Saprospiraceae bacterium]
MSRSKDRGRIDYVEKLQPVGQLRWTYLDDFGGKYNVGLYHGENSGHVMLYVNSSIVLIDFSIKDTKKYSLFIGEELCDLTLEKKNGNFSYGLVPNTEVDTRLNQLRRRINIRDNIKTCFMGFLLVVLILSINFFLSSCS